MLSYSGITVLSFANKVVKVQLRKFVRSLCRVPRTLQIKGKLFKIFLPHYEDYKFLNFAKIYSNLLVFIFVSGR